MSGNSTIKRPDMFGYVAPEPAAGLRSRTTNDPTSRFNQSTAAGRRRNDLLRSFLDAMGNPTNPYVQADAIAAAELTVDAEDARARLAAGTGDVDQVVRLQNLAHRAVRKLGIDRQRGAKPKKSLADYVREKVLPSSDSKVTAA